MNKNRLHNPVVILIISLVFPVLFLSGCAREAAPLRVGMMPAVDIAPFYYAQETGVFQDMGIDVELMLFTSAQNRQTALQTNQIDGAMTDLVALSAAADGDFPLAMVMSTAGLFPLLTQDAARLNGTQTVSVGVMEISVTNYLAEQYLRTYHGIDEFERVFINEIPARLEAVAGGRLTAGIFPEPVATMGELRGLEKIIYTDIPEESLNGIAFSQRAIEEKPDAVRQFLAAYNQAAAQLQADPATARRILSEHIPNLPAEAAANIELPEYTATRLPDSAFVQEILDWTETVAGRSLSAEPSDLIDDSFL